MAVDFMIIRTKLNTTSILEEEVEVVKGYRYLGVHLDNTLGWKSNTKVAYRKGPSRLYFLRKLRSFNVWSKMLHIFYPSVLASAILFASLLSGQQHQTR